MWTEGILSLVLALSIGYGQSANTIKENEDMDLIISDLIQRVRNLEEAREQDKKAFIQSEEQLRRENWQLKQEIKVVRLEHDTLKVRIHQLESSNKASQNMPDESTANGHRTGAYQAEDDNAEGQGQPAYREVLKGKKANDHIRVAGASNNVAFSVKLSTRLVNPGDHHVINFDRIITNVGNDYNTYTGVFTCEVPGLYVFFWNIATDYNDWTKADLMRNGNIMGTTDSGDDDYDDSGSNMVILSLSPSDKVWVEIGVSHDRSAFYIEPHVTSFSGFLLDHLPE